jgi:hypothetical protein
MEFPTKVRRYGPHKNSLVRRPTASTDRAQAARTFASLSTTGHVVVVSQYDMKGILDQPTYGSADAMGGQNFYCRGGPI